MKTNTVRMVLLHSIPSPCAIPGEPPASRTRSKAIGVRIRQHLCLASAVLLLAGAPVGRTEAGTGTTTQMGFAPPAAQVETSDNIQPSTVAHDLSLFRSCGPSHVRYQAIENRLGFGAAQAGKGDDHFATASATDYGYVFSQASVFVRNRDPRDRGTVKLNLRIKAHASAGPDPLGYGPSTDASFQLRVGYLSRTPIAVVWDDDCTVKSADWVFDVIQQPSLFEVWGYEKRWLDLQGDMHTSSEVRTYANGQQQGQTTQSDAPMTVTVEVASNRSVVMSVLAGAAFGGVATIDPIVTAHPDNPDVEIEVMAPDEPTGRHPLDGFTAESLAARGIDPQPFINLGFIPPAAPSDTIPPSTTATPSPGPNASGWNNGAATVNLAAADNAGGSGVKEIHIALAGATTGARVEASSAASVDIAAEGETTLTYFAVDNAGNQEAARTLTVRIDKTPPAFAGLPAAGCALWPPDHQLVQVASVSATDGGSEVALFSLDVTSNEPETGTGDGDASPDIIVTGGTVQVRAERAGNGAGRLYTITARATDRAGNMATEARTCTVPHDRR